MERKSIQEISAILMEKSGLKKKDAERFATTIFEVVKDGLAADRLVKIKGLGTFKVINIESRESINVNTGERVLIEGHEKVTFTPDATMKELVNKPFSQFETVVLNEGVEFDDTVSSEVEAEEIEEDNAVGEVVDVVVEEVKQEESIVHPLVGEPLVEEKPVVESPVVEEPIVEEPIAESLVEEPVVQKEPEPKAGEKPEPEAEEEFDESILEEMELNRKYRIKLRNWGIVALLACVCSFAAGYFVGHHKSETIEPIDIANVPELSAVTDTLEVTVKDSVSKAIIPDTMPSKAKSSENVKPVPVPVATTVAVHSDDYSKYEQMDGRVRYGAYRIVGTAEEVKAKAGETVARISRRYLGPDMECYVEVYNNIKSNVPLSSGQTIKIPKLELKKKKQTKR